MSHKITGKEPLQKPCNCNTQDVLPSKLDIAIAEYKEMARKAEEARDEFLQSARALEDIAKETNATANKNAILAKFDDITIDTSTLAKDATVAKEAQATLNKEAIIAVVNNAKPDLSTVAKQGTDSAVTLTGVDGKVSALPTAAQIQSSLAKEVQVKDGNDTAISVGKEVRSEVGTGSDTAAETGTLSAVLKWTKNKTKDIYNALTDSTNGLSAIKSAIPTVVSIQSGLATASSLSIVASDAAAAKTAAESLTALESDIVAGKTALATAITSKGVTTASTDSMTTMAQNVADISQLVREIDGGDMYAAQLFGDADAAVSPLWNLYDVLAQMKSQFMGAGQYAALIVCEFYRGYDSLQLQGADAYYTSDGDFYDTSAPLHTWHDMDNGRANRWVCFLYATAGANFDITNTAISPRSMYIGGHIGTITYFVNGRLTELVAGVEDTDYIDTLKTGDGVRTFFTQSFLFNTIINGVKNLRTVDFANGGCVILGHDAHITGGWDNWSIRVKYANYLALFGDSAQGILVDDNTFLYMIYAPNAKDFYAKCANNGSTPTIIYTPNAMTFVIGGQCRNLIDVWVGEISQNTSVSSWYPINVLADATKKAQLIENIKNHILARVSDRTGLSQLVFTISTNMYNAIASETITWNDQTMSLADAFLTKNWLLAGA